MHHAKEYSSSIAVHSMLIRENCVNSQPRYLGSLSFTSLVLLQYGGAVFSEMDQQREDVTVGGAAAGKLCSVAGLVTLIDEERLARVLGRPRSHLPGCTDTLIY